MTEEELWDAICKGEYRSKLDYKTDKEAYRADDGRLCDKFRADVLRAFDVEGHPKASLCYHKAWEHGHSAGYSEVFLSFSDLVELIK